MPKTFKGRITESPEDEIEYVGEFDAIEEEDDARKFNERDEDMDSEDMDEEDGDEIQHQSDDIVVGKKMGEVVGRRPTVAANQNKARSGNRSTPRPPAKQPATGRRSGAGSTPAGGGKRSSASTRGKKSSGRKSNRAR